RKNWPKTAQALSAELERLAPALRALGWDVQRDRTGKGTKRKRVLRITRRVSSNGGMPSSASSASFSALADQDVGSDVGVGPGSPELVGSSDLSSDQEWRNRAINDEADEADEGPATATARMPPMPNVPSNGHAPSETLLAVTGEKPPGAK